MKANLLRLNADAGLPYIQELIARKTGGSGQERLSDAEGARYRAEYERLFALFEEAGRASSLPEVPTAEPALNDLLLRLSGVRPSSLS